MTTAQTDLHLTCVFLARFFHILQPCIIRAMSLEIAGVLENVVFDLILGDPNYAAVSTWNHHHKRSTRKSLMPPDRGLIQAPPIHQSCPGITKLDPGYFAYRPAYKRMFYIVYLLQMGLIYTLRRVVLSSPLADSAQGNIMANVESSSSR